MGIRTAGLPNARVAAIISFMSAPPIYTKSHNNQIKKIARQAIVDEGRKIAEKVEMTAANDRRWAGMVISETRQRAMVRSAGIHKP